MPWVRWRHGSLVASPIDAAVPGSLFRFVPSGRHVFCRLGELGVEAHWRAISALHGATVVASVHFGAAAWGDTNCRVCPLHSFVNMFQQASQ